MQYIFNVVTGRIIVSTLAAFLLKNEDRYIEVDLTNPTETNKAAETRAAELGVKLTAKPVDLWLDYISYIDTLSVVKGDPLYNYIKDAGMELPIVIELDDNNVPEQSTAVAEITTTVTVTDMTGGNPEIVATAIAGKIADATVKVFSETDPDVKPTVIESPAASTDSISQPMSGENNQAFNAVPEPQVTEVMSADVDDMVQVALAGHRSYEEVLTALSKNGYFVDTVEGEVEKVSKDLYGFQHDGSFIVLSPKVIASGSEDFVFLQSIKVLQHFPADGATVCIPTYGDMFGVACGTPTPTALTEDVVNLHNKLIQTVGYNGKGSLVSRIDPDGKEVIMAGYLVSLTQPQ